MRIAVIGAGMIGRAHVDILRRDPHCVVAGIADPTAGAATYAAKLGVPCFADPGAMLDATRPDGAIMATPNALHLPPAASLRGPWRARADREADRRHAGAERSSSPSPKSGITVLVGHHRRHNPLIEEAREIVARRPIGRVTAVAAVAAAQADDYYDGGVAARARRRADPDQPDPRDRQTCASSAARSTACRRTANTTRGYAVEDTVAAR